MADPEQGGEKILILLPNAQEKAYPFVKVVSNYNSKVTTTSY